MNGQSSSRAPSVPGAQFLSSWLAVSLTLLAGCHPLVSHRDTNAPGLVDVELPPAQERQTPKTSDGSKATDPEAPPTPEQPGDPGEAFTVLSPGIYLSGGGRFGRPAGQRGAGMFGVELSYNRGESPFSHNGDDFIVYPVEGFGASIGWTLLALNSGEVDLGPIYLEAHRFHLLGGVAAGYSVDPVTGDHGPQATLWATALYVRARYLFDDGFGLFVGGQFKIPKLWVRSR